MASTPHALTHPKAALYAALAAPPDTSTAAARVVEYLIEHNADKAFREAQRARREAEDALSLIRAFVELGPDVRALTGLARDAAELLALVESPARLP